VSPANDIPLAKDAVSAQSDETIIEARYNISIDKGLSVMPDLQYVIHPGAGRTYDNALVLALQIKTDF
jgi:porin